MKKEKRRSEKVLLKVEARKSRAQSYRNWTDIGVDCENSGNSCYSCYIHKLIGLLHNNENIEKRCYQPEANEILKEKGIPMPRQEFKFVRYELEQDERD